MRGKPYSTGFRTMRHSDSVCRSCFGGKSPLFLASQPPRRKTLVCRQRPQPFKKTRKGTVQRSGGSSRLRQLWAWRGDWIEHTTEPGAEHAVVDRAADLKKQIGASPRPSHLLRFIHSPVDQEIRGTFGN